MSDALGAAANAGVVVGMAIAAIAVIALIASVRDMRARARALGFVFVGLSVAVASGAVFLISALGDRLPIIAGLPVVAFAIFMAVLLRLAASREFQRSRAAEPDDGGTAP